MYAPQQTPAVVNNAIQTALQTYLGGQYYGSIIQLNSVLDTISSVTGVQNARWTNDVPGTPPTQVRVIETDVNGNELAGAAVQRWVYGSSSSKESQLLTITGAPNGETYNSLGSIPDNFTLTWTDTIESINVTTPPIEFATLYAAIATDRAGTTSGAAAAIIQTAITSVLPLVGPYAGDITVSDQFWNNVDDTAQFILAYNDNGTPFLPTITQQVSSSYYTYDSDFFLLDDQLPSLPANAGPGDTAPGLVIQVRAQNAWLTPYIGPIT
jgi:hypothetical protein